MKRHYILFVLGATAALLMSACGGGAAPGGADLLSDVTARGYILISTDPNYEPQSFLNTSGSRPADTKCPSDALTTAEMQGFDVDVATEIGTRLGVETCFATPEWDMITAGSWANKWDLSVGSMTITPDRQERLDFTTPYYYTPAVIAVNADSGITSLEQLSGQTICVATATTYESWLNGALDLPAESIYAQPPAGLEQMVLPTDQECAQAIQAGRTEFVGYITSGTVVDSNIAGGLNVAKVDGAVFAENLAAAVDKASAKPTASFLEAVSGHIDAMHADGTLAALSMKWFDTDLTQDPSK
ncbi:MAG TPA: transporter substrate-binding domain-containing protein [Anaerolineales bacterium]|nr:transporter substrate-binding domain-containing protein [Anaerolineales bacterium]